jgi:hypothetical protein
MNIKVARVTIAVLAACVCWGAGAGAAVAATAESKRLTRAKDFIAEEQWQQAVEELRAASRDPKETSKDEVLFWLAHSFNQIGDSASSLTTINQLEWSHPSSRWVKPARALRIEIAVRLGRSDVLWRTALPPAPPSPPSLPAAAVPLPPVPPGPPTVSPPLTMPATPAVPAQPTPPTLPAPPAPPTPAAFWIPESYVPDLDLRIQALRALIRIDADKAIPMLKEIALEADNTDSAGRAVFVLAQSDRPQARETVVQVARTGPKHVRVAAVRELGRFGGPDAPMELLRVYPTGDIAVKRQVVRSLGELRARGPLLSIARSEADLDLRSRAILMLGRAGGSSELRELYSNAGEAKRPIILSLFNARAENELIQIAQRERDRSLQQEVFVQLRLLGTPRAKEYLQKIGQER